MSDDPWEVTAGAFPAKGTVDEQLRHLVRYAILAPSGHNAQPWLFRVRGNVCEVIADRTRGLAVVDPEDRELTISCGAALGHLELAARRFGLAPETRLAPDPDDPDLLAHVTVRGGDPATDDETVLFDAITARRTTRRRFEDRPLPDEILERCVLAAEGQETGLRFVTVPAERSRVAELVAEGDRIQFGDPRFRRELSAWIHSRRAHTRDGLSADNLVDRPDVLSPVTALVVRTFDMGDGIAAQDEAIAVGSPVLAILSTQGDEMVDWLRAGRALARVLLTVTAAGATAAFLNQPIEVAELRPKLRDETGIEGMPQILLRLGYGPEVPPTARRPLDSVLVAE